jgi:PAS domain S-box-containing protein
VSWVFRLYIAFLLLNAVFTTVLAISTFRLRHQPGGLPLSLLMLAVAEWSLVLGVEYAVNSIPAKVLLARIEYVGIMSSPVLLLMFALELTRQRKGIRFRYLIPLWIIPLLTMGLALTNQHHRLLWTGFTPNPATNGNLLIYTRGPWFWVVVAYIYLVLCAATVLLVRGALRFRHLYRRQFVVLLLSLVPPWLASAIYLVGPDPIQGLELAPVGFALSGLLLVWSFRRLHLMDLLPVARDVVIEEMGEGVIVLDRENRILDLNPAAQALLGLEDEVAIGRDGYEVFGKWLGEGTNPLESAEAEAEVFLEGTGYVEWRVSSLGERGDGPAGRLLILRDVTERRVAQDELRRLNATLERQVEARTARILAEKERNDAILRSVGDAILMTDRDSRVCYVNAAFSALTGFQEQEVTNCSISDLMEKLCPNGVGGRPAEEPIGESVWRGEVRARRKDGLAYDAALTIAPVLDPGGAFEGHVCTIRDITQRERLVRARDRFIENVSHQFRTPVATLQLYAHLMRQETLPEKLAEYLVAMEEQIRWLNVLIEDVIQMTALDTGKGVSAWKPTSLQRMVDGIVETFADRFEAAQLHLEILPLPADLPQVRGDEARLAQALSEIVENALVFTPAGGRVTLKAGSVREDGEKDAVISVTDTGPGIPLEEQDRVFDRFFRGSIVASGQIPGTGLGLSVAQAIVEAHGGQITVESDREGSTFTVRLPAV